MKYYSYFVVCIVVGLCGACAARPAQAAVITEIMYDVKDSDADREWIEIDTQSLTAPLDQMRISVGASNHLLKSSQNVTTMPNNTICVIVQSESKFKGDYPSFSGCIFEASFSLTNTTNKIKLLNKTSGEIYDSIEYINTMGAAGDGNSLTKVQTVLVAKLPTPGISQESTQTTGAIPGSGDTTQTNPPSSTGSESQNPPGVPPSAAPDTFSGSRAPVDETSKFSIILEKPVSVFAYEQIDIPVLISQTLGREIRYFQSGSLYISYGDGTIQNISDSAFKIRHIYRNPTMVTLQMYYHTSYLVDIPDAELTIKILVKPLPLTFSLSKKREITIVNEDIQDINLSGMILTGANNSVYEFPYGLIVSGKGNITLSPSMHHLRGSYFLFKDRSRVTISKVAPPPKDSPIIVKKQPKMVRQAQASEIIQQKDEISVVAQSEKTSTSTWPRYVMIFGLGLLVSWLIDYVSKYVQSKQKKSTTRGDEFSHDELL